MPKAKDRGNGEGSVYFRKGTGKWYAELMIGYAEDGKTRRVLREKFATKTEANTCRARWVSDRARGLLVDSH